MLREKVIGKNNIDFLKASKKKFFFIVIFIKFYF